MPSSRANLALAATAAGALALLPRPVLPLVASFNPPTTFLLAPVRGPARSVMVWLRGPATGGPGPDDPRAAELERQRDEYRTLCLQLRQEREDLLKVVRDLSRGIELNPSISVKQILAPVIGFGTDISGGLMTVRAGTAEGVEPNAVVVVRGVQLVGRVQKTDSRTCAVLPITDPAFAKINAREKFSGVVMLDDQKRGPRWLLDTIENGRLIGKVYFDAVAPGEERPKIAGDMLVLLQDPRWPASAQMLTIGRITGVQAGANDRPVITIEPTQDVAHSSEVFIRIAEQPAGPDAAAPGGAATGGGKPTGGRP